MLLLQTKTVSDYTDCNILLFLIFKFVLVTPPFWPSFSVLVWLIY